MLVSISRFSPRLRHQKRRSTAGLGHLTRPMLTTLYTDDSVRTSPAGIIHVLLGRALILVAIIFHKSIANILTYAKESGYVLQITTVRVTKTRHERT